MPGSVSGLFGGGGGAGDVQFLTSQNIHTPGYQLASQNDGLGSLNTSLVRKVTPASQAFDARFPRILSDIDTLRGTIRPGFSDVRQSRLAQVANARSAALGNLRDSFQQRRIAGSSFAADALTRAEREFGEAAQQAEAQSFLEELQANREILTQEVATVADQLNRELDELNIAQGNASQFASIISQNIAAEAQLRAQEAESSASGFGSLLGTGLSLALSPASGFNNSLLGSLFGASGAAGSASAISSAGLSNIGAGAFLLSSKEAKDDIGAAPRVLDALADLPIRRWRYIGDRTEHIGPYAEDFAEAFGVGDGRTIAVTDYLGVMLKALQELGEARHG